MKVHKLPLTFFYFYIRPNQDEVEESKEPKNRKQSNQEKKAFPDCVFMKGAKANNMEEKQKLL